MFNQAGFKLYSTFKCIYVLTFLIVINIFCFCIAVYFEQKEYKKCIEQCEKAVEVGRENRADFKLIAKAFSRIGNAYKKLEVRIWQYFIMYFKIFFQVIYYIISLLYVGLQKCKNIFSKINVRTQNSRSKDHNI